MTEPTASPFAVQIAVDCAAPHELADWWAQVLRWEVEPQDEAFIRRMVDLGQATEADTTTHRGRLVWRAGAAVQAPEGAPQRVRLLFQTVPEPKTVKNRVHLDLRPQVPAVEGPTDDAHAAHAAHSAQEAHRALLDAERERLRALGAREIGHGTQGPHSWTVFTDPEGNEFCL